MRLSMHPHWLAALIWIVSLGAGFGRLLSYAGEPGAPAAPAASWPAGSKVERAAGIGTLLIFAHPKCPCTAATIAELERLLVETGGKIEGRVVFRLPSGMDPAAAKGALWRKAAAVKGVRVFLDEAGREASLFDAKTSGQAYLYDAGGTLKFRGGLTPARGHQGESPGRDAVLAIAAGRAPASAQSRVFGCALEKAQLMVRDEK